MLNVCLLNRLIYNACWIFVLKSVSPRGRGGGNSRRKGAGMLVVSFRDVNCGFCSRLACSLENVIIFCREGLV